MAGIAVPVISSTRDRSWMMARPGPWSSWLSSVIPWIGSVRAADLMIWRRAAGIVALAAPLAYALSAAVGVAHTTNTDRQLDIIAAHTARFAAMVMLEQARYLLAAATAIAVAIRLACARGGRLAGVAAVLVAIGAAVNLAGFAGAIPNSRPAQPRTRPLLRGPPRPDLQHVTGARDPAPDRAGPHAGCPVAIARCRLALAGRIGRRGGGSVVIGTGRVENTTVMFVRAGGFLGIARFLAQPPVGD